MSSANDYMRKTVEVANEEIQQQRKTTIAAWIKAAFFMIPVAGEVAGLVGGPIMRTIIQLAGALADDGYTIYDTVKNPDNIALGIVVRLLGDFHKEPFKNAAYKLRSAPKGGNHA